MPLPNLNNKQNKNVINKNFLLITPKGEVKNGADAFSYWCQKNHINLDKTATEYIQTLKKYNAYKKNGLIDGMNKLKDTFDQVYLDKIYYLDFYSIERFGKTKLGTLLLYAKQSQNRQLINQIYEIIKEKIFKIIKNKKIDAVAFIPHTIPRKIQLMKELENKLSIKLPKIKLVKTTKQIPIAQKSLNKLSDRVENVKNTIFVDDNNIYNNILLIDDAIGSGATLNETAKKIKDKKLCKGKIIGLAITGSFKGFDIINEV